MDNRFKNAMNAIEPDESMVERIIKSEVALFRRALTLLCWGLALACFNISIEGIELALYTSWAGNAVLVLGLWMIRSENRRMSAAFRFGILLLVLRTASYWLGAFPDNDRMPSYFLSFFVTILSYIVFPLVLFCLFSGLSELARRFENHVLAKRLKSCFWLYISLYLLTLLCLLVPPLLYPLIPYAIFVLIKLPLTVHKLKAYVPLGRRETSVKALNKRVWITLCLYITVTIGGEFGFLYYVNAPRPETRLYVNSQSAETAEIREKMLEFGLPEDILADLPEDEIKRYEGIYHAETRQINSPLTNRDGGKLEAFCFNAVMPEGRIRTLCYYRWLENPRHAYVDLLSFPVSMQFLLLSDTQSVKALSLYDKDGKTHSQTLLNEGNMVVSTQVDSSMFGTFGGGLTAQMQFRLYPQYENQRGYLAVEYLVKEPSEPRAFWLGATYVHQESLWNRPYFNPLGETSSNGYSHIQNGRSRAKAFWSDCFDSNLHYEPEGWVWTE